MKGKSLINRSRFKNIVIGIVGPLGCGKTILLTYLGLYFRRKKGFSVYSDYDLNFPHTRVTDLEQLRDSENIKTDNVFLFDELWVSADVRRSSDERNIELTRWVLQSRKKRFSLIYTAQLSRLIESRIKGVTNLVLKPQIVRYDKYDKPKLMIVSKFSLDASGYLKSIGKAPLNVSKICDLYNTEEVIKLVNIKTKYDKVLEEVKEKLRTGELKVNSKKELVAVLVQDYKLSINRAGIVASYIRGGN